MLNHTQRLMHNEKSHHLLLIVFVLSSLLSCCWQFVSDTPSLAPAARDLCCLLLPTSSTWLTAMTVLPLPWQHTSNRSLERERAMRPRKRWHTRTHTKDLARSINQHIYWIKAMQQFWEKIELLLPLAFYGSVCFNLSHIPHLIMVNFQKYCFKTTFVQREN